MGLRTPADAFAFMDDLSGRIINIGTLTTDGLNSYPEAVSPSVHQYNYEVSKGRAPESIAVWAVHTRLETEGQRIRLLTCPRHQMSFPHAQDGVFLFDYRPHFDYLTNGEWPPWTRLLGTWQASRKLSVNEN